MMGFTRMKGAQPALLGQKVSWSPALGSPLQAHSELKGQLEAWRPKPPIVLEYAPAGAQKQRAKAAGPHMKDVCSGRNLMVG